MLCDYDNYEYVLFRYALFHHLNFRRSGLNRQVLAVRSINNITHNNIQPTGRSLVVIAVVAIVDGDKSHTEKGKQALKTVADFDVVTGKP